MRVFVLILACIAVLACTSPKSYRILGNIEDPQNEIAVAMASVLNKRLADTIVVSPGIGSLANIDSLIEGKAELAIVDNYSSYRPGIASIMPVYGQIVHVLHRKTDQAVSLQELFNKKKIFAGTKGSGSWMFVKQLLADNEIKEDSVEFLLPIDLFDADVIVAFTNLLSANELADLKGYTLYSFDDVANLGKGSLVEGICARHPQFEPFVLPKNVYGDFTPSAVLSLKVDALLVCSASLDEEFVFNILENLNDHKQEITSINPLLSRFSGDFNPHNLSFALHEGARKYLSRYEPGFFERNADLLGVVISILLAIASASYSFMRWQRMKKKNKIDVYYTKVIDLRNRVSMAKQRSEIVQFEIELKNIQEETIKLVTEEKLYADESFSIFLNLSRFVMEEILKKDSDLSPDKDL